MCLFVVNTRPTHGRPLPPPACLPFLGVARERDQAPRCLSSAWGAPAWRAHGSPCSSSRGRPLSCSRFVMVRVTVQTRLYAGTFSRAVSLE